MRRRHQIGSLSGFVGLMVAAMVAVVMPVTDVKAEKSAANVCGGLAKKAQRTLWSSVREAGDDLYCRKSWLSGRAGELEACGVWTQANLFGNRLKGLWNRMFAKADAEWATWGPRGISVDWEAGTIRGGFKRTFFGAGLGTFKSTVEVVKEGGKAEAHITVCELNYEGGVVSSHRRSIEKGAGTAGKKVAVEIEHTNNRILGVVVDTPASANQFEYRVRLLSTPKRNNLGKATGIADLHVHQFVSLAFGGRMYWGQHDGPKPQALAKEVVTADGSGLSLTDPVKLGKRLARLDVSLDANVLLHTLNSTWTDEGFYTLGTDGHPSFSGWPHHADRSHQQVYIDWLKEAHQRGKGDRAPSNLSLMVVSLVNNNILCSLLKLIDKQGNVPKWDGKGKVVGWESGPWGCSDQENVTRQLRALHDLEKKYPWYRVAMSPWHARQIIADGDLAVVISMETDKPLSGSGNNYGNWEHQLDQYRAMGLSTMQLVHEADSIFAGAAPHRDMMMALQVIHNPLQAASNAVVGQKPFELDGRGYNKLALTAEGNRLVDAMVKRNMPIDLAHMSSRARRATMKRVPKGWGLYDSHTKFECLMMPFEQCRLQKRPPAGGSHVLQREKEFLVTHSLLPLYKQHDVLVGLRTAPVDVEAAPGAKVRNDCPGSARSFAQLVQYAHDSGLEMAYGTDFNTGVSQLGPRFGPGRCFAALPKLDNHVGRRVGTEGRETKRPGADTVTDIDGTNYYVDGLATIGWLPELTRDLDHLGTPGASKLRESAEAYLNMWERAFPVVMPTVGADPVGTIGLGGTCRKNQDCKSDKCTGLAGAYGQCVCNDDGDCGASQWCNAGVDLTKNKCEPKRQDNETCPAVGGGHACNSGQCKWSRCYTSKSVAMGGTCYNDDACKIGKCSAIDGARGTCVCKADTDCGSGYWCDAGMDLKQNQCKKKLQKGEVCGIVGELGVGHRCKSGKCKVSGVSTKLKCK